MSGGEGRFGAKRGPGPFGVGSSPWQRLTERGLQWRVEGCPQEVCAAVFSCKAGVRRAHLVDYTVPGALLLELYTYGVGAMVSRDRYEGTRPAKPGDWIHIKSILGAPREERVHRAVTDEALIAEVRGVFHVGDGTRRKVIACAALVDEWNESNDKVGQTSDERGGRNAHKNAWNAFGGDVDGREVAAFAVRPGYRNEGRGDQLLQYLESRARRAGVRSSSC